MTRARSYVEREYELACAEDSIDRLILLFEPEPGQEVSPDLREVDEDQTARQQAFRKRLSAENLCKKVFNPEGVSEAIRDWLEKLRPLGGAPPDPLAGLVDGDVTADR